MKLLYKIYFKLERLIDNERVRMLKKRMKYCGTGVYIHPSCHILGLDAMEIGNNCSIASFTTIYAKFGLKIGDNCLISSNCGISSYNHIQASYQRPLDTAQDGQYSQPVLIGNNVWIGMNACVLPGVSIGDNSIIGSGSVVTKSIPANEIWVGNPARFVRKIDFSNKNEYYNEYIGNNSYM